MAPAYKPGDFKGSLEHISSNSINNQEESECSGIVIEQDSKEAVSYAIIKLLNDENNYNTLTDESGHFELANVVPGEYEIKVSLVGYYPFRDTIVLKRGKKEFYRIMFKHNPDATF